MKTTIGTVRISLVACTALTAALAMTAPALADKLVETTAVPDRFVSIDEIAIPFMDAVSEATDGEATIALACPDAVWPLKRLEPIQAGVVDQLVTHSAPTPPRGTSRASSMSSTCTIKNSVSE